MAQCFDRFESEVFGFLLARTGNRSVAEDLTTETFLSLARRVAGEMSASEDLHAGLVMTIARRRLIDHWREVAARERRLELAGARSIAERGPLSGDDLVEARDQRVLDALASLPARQRGALTLRYVEDLSVAGVADVLGSSVTATESLLARARRSFEQALVADPGGGS